MVPQQKQSFVLVWPVSRKIQASMKKEAEERVAIALGEGRC
jgi:hypothetical protein